ncbi:sigma-54 dependent transcriptional regulator [Salinisphaera sp. C84B14]|uniref:sigma-54-dependent Fis family transcriptional regulator n=1 Tax=Salinisphaera sp. C84B14 TaxID=1304155 RepID=UPI0033426736
MVDLAAHPSTATVHGDSADLVAGSWNRCIRDYGLDPARIELDVVSRSQLSAHRDELAEVVCLARDEMDNLAAQIAGAGYALMITDAHGVILYNRVEASLRENFRAAGLWDGANWSEWRQGTNGIGTCIVEQRPVVIHCADHFAVRHTGLSCSAAPIRNAAGELLAVLDASSVQCEGTRAGQMHTVALVSMSARLIEKNLFLNAHRDSRVLRFHGRPEFVGLIHDGLLAIDDDDRIVAADDNAALQLGADGRQALIGESVEQVFDIAGAALDAATRNAGETVWPLHERARGRRYFARLSAPEGRRAVPRGLYIPARAADRRPGLDELAGADPVMAENVRCARRVVDRRIAIMLRGETGTGKEVFARAIHEASTRATAPFVAVNCAAIPETLIEAELFGYKPGAFTGASREGMRGKLLQSSGGTLFLDEIGDMPLALQTRLLRVLEEREVVPLGGDTPIALDLNVVCATHADLGERVAAGDFRADLYYRLDGITLTLASVRQRADREALLRSVIAAEQDGSTAIRLAEDAMAALLRYDWPGNIRQMRNVVRTALALCEDGLVRLSDLPDELVEHAQRGDVLARAAQADVAEPANPLANAERDALIGTLEASGWNVTRAALQLQTSRNTLYRKMKKHGIEPSQNR